MRDPEELPHLVRLRITADEHRLLERDRLGRGIARALDLGVRDHFMVAELERRVREHTIAQAFQGPFSEARGTTTGPILGFDHVTQAPFRVSLESIGMHLYGATATGGGKTSLIVFLVLQLWALAREMAIWLCDSSKRELRGLRPLAARLGVDLAIVRAQDARINILESGGDPAATHAPGVGRVTDLLCRTLELPPRARTILAAACASLATRHGNSPACLIDLFECVRRGEGLNAPAKEALLDRLGHLILALGPSARCRRGWSPIDLSSRSIVWEFADASESAKQTLIGHLIHTTMAHRIRARAINRIPDLMVVLDDAQRMLAESQGHTGDLPPLTEAAGLIRSTGMALMAFTQSLDGVPRGLLANLSTKLVGRLGTGQDYRDAADTLGLTGDQLRWAQHHLERGMWICQVADGPSRAPCVLRVPRPNLPTNTDDAEAQRSLAALGALRVEMADEYVDWSPHERLQVHGSSPTSTITPTTPTHTTPSTAPASSAIASTSATPMTSTSDVLSHAEARFLEAVLESQGEPSSSLPRRAGMSPRRCLALRDSLAHRGLLRIHHVNRAGKGRTAIVLEVTEAGHAALQRAGGTS